MILNSPYITGSLTVTGNTILSGSVTLASGSSIAGTASLATTASYAVNATTASYAVNATTASYAANSTTASYAVNTTTSSYATTASYADTFTVANTLTAQTLVVQTITSSIDFVTGSTRFGSLLANTHIFSGSVTMNPNGLFVSSSGNVGIGTTTPSSPLQINYSNSGSAINAVLSGFALQNTNSTSGAINSLFFVNSGGYGSAAIYTTQTQTGNAGDNLILTTKNSGGGWNTGLIVSSSGYVGIGTTSPTDPLVVQTNVNAQRNVTFKNTDTTNTDTRQGLYLTAGSNTMSFLTIHNGGNYIQGTSNQSLYFQQTAGGTVNMTISSSGYVGIGTTSPSTILHVSGGANGYAENITLTSTSAYGGFGLWKGTTHIGTLGFGSAGNIFNNSLTDAVNIYSVNALQLGSGANAAITISTSNNVGIGSTTPQRALVVARSNGQGIEFDNQTGYATILSYNRTTSTYTPLTMGEGTTNVGIGTTTPSSKLEVNGNVTVSGIIAAGTTSGNDTGLRVDYGNGSSDYGRLRFYENGTNRNTIHSFGNSWGSSFTASSRGAINIEGYNGVTLGPWNNPDFYITQNQGNAYIKGTLTVNSTITENSSIRYKTNIETIKYGLDKVLQLRGVTYDKKDTGIRELGLIAEEVNKILPDIVIKNEEGEPDSVSYGRLTAVLIEAVKDLQAQINELKAK